MQRRLFLGGVAALLGSTVAGQTFDRQQDAAPVHFYCRMEPDNTFRPVAKSDIKTGDNIIVVGIDDGVLYAQACVVDKVGPVDIEGHIIDLLMPAISLPERVAIQKHGVPCRNP